MPSVGIACLTEGSSVLPPIRLFRQRRSIDVVSAGEELHRWRLGLRQYSFRHVSQVSRELLPYTSSGVARFTDMLLSPLAFAAR